MSKMLPVLRIPTTVHNGVRLECYFHVAYFETSRDASSVSPKEQLHNAAARPHSRILICSAFLTFCVSSHHQVQP